MSADYRDEWGRDGFGDGSSPAPSDGGPGSPGVDSYLDEPMTDAEGNPIEYVEPPSGEQGETHLRGEGPARTTLCCGVEVRDLPNGDALTVDEDAVTCSWAMRGSGDPSVDPAEHEYEQPGGDPVDDARQPTADEITRSMGAYARAVRDESREHASHTDGDPRFDPEQGVVICGCGEPIDEGPDGSGYTPMRAPENLSGTPAADPVLSDLPNLDPLAHYTPADLERALLETIRRLDQGLAMQAQWQEVYERAVFKYDKAAARARLRVKGGAKDVRDAEVRVACEREADDVAEARLRFKVIDAAMHTLRSVLSGYQSVGRSVGVLVQAGGGDGGKPYRRDAVQR